MLSLSEHRGAKMTKNKLEALTLKRNQINAQIQAVKAKEQAQKRKDDTRRKVLIGSVLLKMVKDKEMEESQLLGLLKRHLVKPTDRALFNLDD